MGTTKREFFIGAMKPADVFSKVENWLGENGFKVLKKTDNYLKARKRVYAALLYFEFTLAGARGGTGVHLEGYVGDPLSKLTLKDVLYLGRLPRRKGLELLQSLARYFESLSEKKVRFTPPQIERMVHSYIVEHEGEIDIEKCAEELGLSRDNVERAVKSLVEKGKLERE